MGQVVITALDVDGRPRYTSDDAMQVYPRVGGCVGCLDLLENNINNCHMEQSAGGDIFAATVAPIIRVAKAGGASARSLSDSFLGAMTDLYGDVDLKETSAMVGFIQLLSAEGGSVSAKNAARLYGGPNDYSEEAVRKAARNGQLIAIRDGSGNLHFPVWQFGARGGSLPGLREVLAVLLRRPQADDLAAVTFLLNPTSRLGGASPLEALRRGDKRLAERVRQLALEASE